MTSENLFQSVIQDDFDQGDPNVFEVPYTHRANYDYRYYAFVTDDSQHGRSAAPDKAFPCYGSNDVFNWDFLGFSLTKSDDRTRWAPYVGFYAQLERPFVMLYSRARGSGEDAHVQHKIRRADSVHPHGPYIDSGEVLTEDIDFAIDPQVYRDKSGRLRLAFATDFVDDEPLGTGLADVAITDDLRSTFGPLRTIVRAKSDWQVYESSRVMPWKLIPNVDFTQGETVRWHCIEGPVAGIVSPNGRHFLFYSSGNFNHFYAIGIIEELDDGSFHDLSVDNENCFLKPDPEKLFYSVGRIGLVTAPDGQEYVSFHARFGSPHAPRRLGFAKLSWTKEGLPQCQSREALLNG